jgi:hypothetical protein
MASQDDAAKAINEANDTVPTGNTKAWAKIQKARKAYNKGDYDEAYRLAREALNTI